MDGTLIRLHIWTGFFVAAIMAWRKPKACTSCNELTYPGPR